MRLRDLDAAFLDQVSVIGSRRLASESVDGAQGVLFQCPSCAAGKDVVADLEREGRRYVVGAHSIQVLFSNPRGVEPAPADAGVTGADHTSHPRWQIEGGTSLDDLTLSPSINCDIPWTDDAGVEHPSVCKFHGYVKNGEAA